MSYKNIILLENIRSAYNVGNTIRTADALGRDVWLIGYTPSPYDTPKVQKTSLGSEKSVNIQRFDDIQKAISSAKDNGFTIISAEISQNSKNLSQFLDNYNKKNIFAVIFGNEINGVSSYAINKSDHILHIPMLGIKESLNIGQSTAIFMRELRK